MFLVYETKKTPFGCRSSTMSVMQTFHAFQKYSKFYSFRMSSAKIRPSL